MPTLWGEKRYHSLSHNLHQHFGEKLYKISLHGGMTCPNRDGTIGSGGCVFCSTGGSGEFSGNPLLSVTSQIGEETGKFKKKYHGHAFIAYFQAYTNTYAPVEKLRELFTEAIMHPDIKVLSIATRPDCLSSEIISLLAELCKIKPVWVELGLQTIHSKTALLIRRGYELPVFDEAVKRLRNAKIDVIVHTIAGLPGETPQDYMDTIAYLNRCDIQGIKLQMLQILKGTDLASSYMQAPFPLPGEEDYVQLIGRCISLLRPDIVIHRVTGDPPHQLLIAPRWCASKWTVFNKIQTHLQTHDIWQGKEYNNV